MSKIIPLSVRLKEALDYNGTTLVELSKKSGISYSTLRRYMRGETEPRQNGIFYLAKALDVSPVWLLGYDESEKKPKAVS
ncbi:MAG: helix-turn-helix domain-containing protein [Lachnospiraceae bacterium]|nr:helix-turn-helix domain-containing protein [Lachnospiraceae bacterium]